MNSVINNGADLQVISEAADTAAPRVTTCQQRSKIAPDVSVVIPVYNEEECIAATIRETLQVLEELALNFELIVVDDGSTDGSGAILSRLRRHHPGLRVFAISPNAGQSAAFGVGFRESRGRILVLMDADGQNDPHDIPQLLHAMDDCDLCCGYRAVRRDSLAKRFGGQLANAVRRRILDDGIRDTGCSLKAMRADLVRDLPMNLRGMHRFIPALLQMKGACVRQVAVHHRPRLAGRSKYTNFGRLRETVHDLRAVHWMQSRYRRFTVVEDR